MSVRISRLTITILIEDKIIKTGRDLIKAVTDIDSAGEDGIICPVLTGIARPARADMH